LLKKDPGRQVSVKDFRRGEFLRETSARDIYLVDVFNDDLSPNSDPSRGLRDEHARQRATLVRIHSEAKAGPLVPALAATIPIRSPAARPRDSGRDASRGPVALVQEYPRAADDRRAVRATALASARGTTLGEPAELSDEDGLRRIVSLKLGGEQSDHEARLSDVVRPRRRAAVLFQLSGERAANTGRHLFAQGRGVLA
jgi:hypothetical protein